MSSKVYIDKVQQASVQTVLMDDAKVKLVWRDPDAGATPREVRVNAAVLRVDPESGGANESLVMPPEGESAGVLFFVHNFGGESVLVRNSADSGTLATLLTGEFAPFQCDGVAWRALPPASTDFGGGGIMADVVAESTGAAGVTVDGVLLKDSRIQATGVLTGVAGVTLTDNLASAWDIKEGANVYLAIATTNDAERIVASKLHAVPTQSIDMADAAVALVYGTAGAGEVKLTGQVLFVDPNSGGASEVLTLPPEATSAGVVLDIFNSGGEGIAVEDDAAGAVLTIPAGKAGRVACNGTTWRGLLGA